MKQERETERNTRNKSRNFLLEFSNQFSRKCKKIRKACCIRKNEPRNVCFSTVLLHAYGEVDEERKWNEILEVMVSIYTMPSIFPFSYFQIK